LDPEAKRKSVIRSRREREKQRRIDSILESAKKVFFAKGYAKASIDEIALGAEISKPTIYQYFKTKDELYFTLMLPVIEEIGRQLKKIEDELATGKIKDGARLLRRVLSAFYKSYEISPEAFRIVQIFQQQVLFRELDPDIRDTMNQKGRYNFYLGRRILTQGIERGWIKNENVYELADLMWGTVVGVIQLEDIKGDDAKGDKYKKKSLALAERIFIGALVQKFGGRDA